MLRLVLPALLLAIACGSAETARPPALVKPSPPRAKATAAPSRAHAKSCVAQPATVYGQEDAVFRVEGEAEPGARIDYSLTDERGQSVSKGTLTPPQELRAGALPSGDFVLIVGANLLSCPVTVNRELSRATQTAH